MVKYRIPYYDLKNNGWRVEISNLSYLGEPITLNTTQGQGGIISWNGTDDPTEPVIVSTAKFTVLKHNRGLIDVKEIKNSFDWDWSVDVYKNDILFWTGYLAPDGTQEAYQSLPYDVDFTATDGLKLLQGTRYSTNNWLLPAGIENRSFISHIRDILFQSSQLGKPLPIRIIGGITQCDSDGLFMADGMTQSIYSPSGEGYTDYNGNQYSSYFVLENYLRALNSRIYQSSGKWIIERIPDKLTGTYSWREINTTYSPTVAPVLTSGTATDIKNIGTDFLVDNGAYTVNLPGLKKVTATYQSNKSENSLPNGSFDSSLFAPFRWFPSNSDVLVEQVPSINARTGQSAQLTFPADAPGSGRREDFTLREGVGGIENRLPIDTATMYKRMSLGFTLMPQNGFPFNTTTGEIQWTDKPFRFMVTCVGEGDTDVVLTLNEFGFWIPKPSGAGWNRYSYVKTDVGSEIKIDSGFEGDILAGDTITLQHAGDAYSIYATQEYAGDLSGFLNYAGDWFVNSTGGRANHYSVTPDGAGRYVLSVWVDEISGAPMDVYNMGYILSTSERDGSIILLPEASKIGDVIQINFDKFQGIKLPDFADYPDVTHASLNILFYINQGQRYTLDDVYMTFDENFEVYKYEYPNKFTDSEDYTLRISSSTNGIYTTNVMSQYKLSYDESKYKDASGYVGTLTDLFCRNVARLRSKSLELFEGTLLGPGFQFGTMYTVDGFEGKLMLPLSATYNTENCETSVSIVELDFGNETFSRSFYGSNDKPLSNEIIN